MFTQTHEVGLREAKITLGEIATLAKNGHKIILKRHGKPVAMIVQIPPTPDSDNSDNKGALINA